LSYVPMVSQWLASPHIIAAVGDPAILGNEVAESSFSASIFRRNKYLSPLPRVLPRVLLVLVRSTTFCCSVDFKPK